MNSVQYSTVYSMQYSTVYSVQLDDYTTYIFCTVYVHYEHIQIVTAKMIYTVI